MARLTIKYSIHKLRQELSSSIRNGCVDDEQLLHLSTLLESRSSTTTEAEGRPPTSSNLKELLNKSCNGHTEEEMGLREKGDVSTTVNQKSSEEAKVPQREPDGPLLRSSEVDIEAAGRQVDECNAESSNVDVLPDDFVSENLDHTTVQTNLTSINTSVDSGISSDPSEMYSNEGCEDVDRTPSRDKNCRPHTGDEELASKFFKRNDTTPTDTQKKRKRRRRSGVFKLGQKSPRGPKLELVLIEKFLTSGAEEVELISKQHVCVKIKQDKWNQVIQRSYNHYSKVVKIPASDANFIERLEKIAEELLSLSGSLEQQVQEYKLSLEEDKKALKQSGGYSRRIICCRVCSELKDL